MLSLLSAFSDGTYASRQPPVVGPPYELRHGRSIQLTSDRQSFLSQAFGQRATATADAFAMSYFRTSSFGMEEMVIRDVFSGRCGNPDKEYSQWAFGVSRSLRMRMIQHERQ